MARLGVLLGEAVLMVAVLAWCPLVVVEGACGADDVAAYKMALTTHWTEARFPKDYPQFRPRAQWSTVFGQTHSASYWLYRVGAPAAAEVRAFAQGTAGAGQAGALATELAALGDLEPRVYDQFAAPALPAGAGTTATMLFLDGNHSLVSLVSRMVPSPDWFVGVDSLDLCVDSAWVDHVSLTLEVLDAGAASGLTYTSPRWQTQPPEAVSRLWQQPPHPAAAFYYPALSRLPPIATLTFTKLKEYSMKTMNILALKEIRHEMFKEKHDAKAGNKDVDVDYDSSRVDNTSVDKTVSSAVETDEPSELLPHEAGDTLAQVDQETATSNPMQQLMNLEEEPVGVPKVHLSSDNVVVVTASPQDFDPQEWDGLKSADEMVLAVATGRIRKGKHLPRHFRSRLHDAINRRNAACRVSAWGEWTSCSQPCGWGQRVRYRSIESMHSAAACPPLQERAPCNTHPCQPPHYFEW